MTPKQIVEKNRKLQIEAKQIFEKAIKRLFKDYNFILWITIDTYTAKASLSHSAHYLSTFKSNSDLRNNRNAAKAVQDVVSGFGTEFLSIIAAGNPNVVDLSGTIRVYKQDGKNGKIGYM